jgi:hypothetical protein
MVTNPACPAGGAWEPRCIATPLQPSEAASYGTGVPRLRNDLQWSSHRLDFARSDDSLPIVLVLRIHRAQVDLGRLDVGVSELLPEGFDVDSRTAQTAGKQYTERMARLLGTLDRVSRLKCLSDDPVDEPY